MGYLSRALKQTAVYWASPTANGWGGRTYADPVEIDCRWVEKQEKFINPQGEEKLSQAVVLVDRDMVIDGYLYLGELSDLSSAEEGDPQVVSGAYLIQAFQKVPTFKADDYLRKVWL